MGKSIDLRVTTRERAWAEGNKGRKRAKKKAGRMTYRRRRCFPLPVIYAMLPNRVNEMFSEPRLFFEGLK